MGSSPIVSTRWIVRGVRVFRRLLGYANLINLLQIADSTRRAQFAYLDQDQGTRGALA